MDLRHQFVTRTQRFVLQLAVRLAEADGLLWLLGAHKLRRAPGVLHHQLLANEDAPGWRHP